jgi:hypothetical protein
MKVRCSNDLGLTKLEVGKKIYEGELKFNEWFGEYRWHIKGLEGLCFKEQDFEIVKGDNMKKTFREVIETIKEGEVWINEVSPISFIRLREDGVLDFNENEGVNLYNTYTLKRKEYTFEEAFKAYEGGKEIESCEGPYRYKKQNGNDAYFDTFTEAWWSGEPITISLQEIRGKWYINN